MTKMGPWPPKIETKYVVDSFSKWTVKYVLRNTGRGSAINYNFIIICTDNKTIKYIQKNVIKVIAHCWVYGIVAGTRHVAAGKRTRSKFKLK